MIAVYGREFEPSGTGLFQHYSATQNFPEIHPVKKRKNVSREGSNARPLPRDQKKFPAWRNVTSLT
jgi:hypothetical protein